ncbi:MAG: hypothetical protein ABFR65_00025 [Pseudomonadota bacterium]
MKKFLLVASVIMFVLASSLSFAAGGHKGGGSSHKGSEGVTAGAYENPRGYGEGGGESLSPIPDDEEDGEENENSEFNKASGAWGNKEAAGDD